MNKTEVKAIQNGDSYSVLIEGKIACEMANGGAHRFRSTTEAEVFGRQYQRGYKGGTFLSDDIKNFVL